MAKNRIFTSGTQKRDGRTVNHDRKPWALYRDGVVVEHYAYEDLPSIDRSLNEWHGAAPRPEFAVLDNPILADLRTYRAEREGMNNPKGWDHVLRKFEQAVSTSSPWAGATDEHVAHARKVLTRLANLQVTQA